MGGARGEGKGPGGARRLRRTSTGLGTATSQRPFWAHEERAAAAAAAAVVVATAAAAAAAAAEQAEEEEE